MNRDELHERVMLLKEEIKAGRVKFREGLNVLDSLQRVRIASDGKVDPNTVDGLVRALASSVALMRFQREAKKIPLKESQAKYFEILDRFFGKPFVEMKKYNLTPPDVAEHMASQPRIVDAFAGDADEFVEGIREFWEYYGPIVEMHLQDMRALKSVFGGDVFPSYRENIASSVGLYIDTLILPDPLLRMADFVHIMKPDQLFSMMTKHALNALQYKDLALADVEPPIVVIAPDISLLEDSYRPLLQVAGEADLLAHSAKLFSRKFANLSELTQFLDGIPNTSELVAQIADPSRLLFDSEWSGAIDKQVQRFISELDERMDVPLTKEPIGKMVQSTLLGRMMQANDVLFKASRFHGNPLIDAPTSWQYLLWKYEYDDNRQISRDDIRDVLITKAISVEGSPNLGLLSGLPPEALIDLRRAGAMSELRDVIRKGIEDVDSASQASFAEVGEAVVTNLSNAFEAHRKELGDLSSARKKFFGLDVGRWVTVGSLSIGAASTGNLALAVLAASLGMVGAPSLEELLKRWREIQARKERLGRSPTGILFRHLDLN
jgi:hypothetical protein